MEEAGVRSKMAAPTQVGRADPPPGHPAPHYRQHFVNVKVSSAKSQDVKRRPSAKRLSPQEEPSGRERTEG